MRSKRILIARLIAGSSAAFAQQPVVGDLRSAIAENGVWHRGLSH